MWDLVKTIAAEKGQSIDEASAECGITHWQFRRIAKGKSGTSHEVWDKIIVWSDGRLTPNHFHADAMQKVGERGDAA